jgi:dTDP-4-amino-4,6-dideoxygalactose transaminase
MIRYIANIPGISPDLLRPVRHPKDLPAWLPRGKSFLTPTGRTALYFGWKATGFRKGTKVLMPSFSCYTVSEPLEAAGAGSLYFRIRRDLSIDWDHVRAIMDPSVKAFVWYHYLGLSFGFDEVIPFCRKHGLVLIEDCAHALFSRYRGKHVGASGDYSVYSVRKSIPTTFAGALVLNNPRFKLRDFRPDKPSPPAQETYRWERENYLHRLYLQSRDPTHKVAGPLYSYHAKRLERFYDINDLLHRIDDTSMLVMHNIDPDLVRKRRHRNYAILLKRLKDLCPFRTITPGAAPIGFPIFHPERERFRKRMLKSGIEFLVHWHEGILPRGVARRFPDAGWLSKRILSLPCHHDLTVKDMEYVARMVRKCW